MHSAVSTRDLLRKDSEGIQPTRSEPFARLTHSPELISTQGRRLIERDAQLHMETLGAAETEGPEKYRRATAEVIRRLRSCITEEYTELGLGRDVPALVLLTACCSDEHKTLRDVALGVLIEHPAPARLMALMVARTSSDPAVRANAYAAYAIAGARLGITHDAGLATSLALSARPEHALASLSS